MAKVDISPKKHCLSKVMVWKTNKWTIIVKMFYSQTVYCVLLMLLCPACQRLFQSFPSFFLLAQKGSRPANQYGSFPRANTSVIDVPANKLETPTLMLLIRNWVNNMSHPYGFGEFWRITSSYSLAVLFKAVGEDTSLNHKGPTGYWKAPGFRTFVDRLIFHISFNFWFYFINFST